MKVVDFMRELAGRVLPVEERDILEGLILQHLYSLTTSCLMLNKASLKGKTPRCHTASQTLEASATDHSCPIWYSSTDIGSTTRLNPWVIACHRHTHNGCKLTTP